MLPYTVLEARAPARAASPPFGPRALPKDIGTMRPAGARRPARRPFRSAPGIFEGETAGPPAAAPAPHRFPGARPEWARPRRFPARARGGRPAPRAFFFVRAGRG